MDACDGSNALTTNNLVNVAVPGSYTVSYVATDGEGRSATNTRIVNVIAARPQMVSPVWLGSGAFQFDFTNQPGVSFTVWASTNVGLPFAQWSNLGAPVQSPGGMFSFTDPQATNGAQRFYRVSSP